MGAITSLMHADRDPSIAGLVLDSPFSSLRELAEDLCKQYSNVPKFVMSAALAMIRSTIKDKAKFDIDKLNPLKNHVKQAFIPAFFIAANQDTFINSKHSQALFDAYAGDKTIKFVDGDHNSARPQYILDSVAIFFHNTLQVEQLVPQVKADKSDKVKNEEDNKAFQQLKQNIQNKIGNEAEVQASLNGFMAPGMF